MFSVEPFLSSKVVCSLFAFPYCILSDTTDTHAANIVVITINKTNTGIYRSFNIDLTLSYGDYIEREKLIEATVWELQEEGYTKDDIKSISSSYNPLKGGVLPYKVYVVFKNNESKIQIYGWTDTDKTEVSNCGETSALNQ